MKTDIHLWSHLAHFFIEKEMFQKIVIEIKTQILCSVTFFSLPKIVPLWDNVCKCYTARQATNDDVIGRMRTACCVTQSTKAHTHNM